MTAPIPQPPVEAVDLEYVDTDGVKHLGWSALVEEAADIGGELVLIANVQNSQSVADVAEQAIAFAAKLRALSVLPTGGGDHVPDVGKMVSGSAQDLSPNASGHGGWLDIASAPKDGSLFVGCSLDHPSFGSWPMHRRVRHEISNKGEDETVDLGGWNILNDLEPDYQEGHEVGPDPAYAIAPDDLNTSVRYGWQPLPQPPSPQAPEAASGMPSPSWETVGPELVEALKPFAARDLYPPDPVERFDGETKVYVHWPTTRKSGKPVSWFYIDDVKRARQALARASALRGGAA